jgi:predicted hydrolase (HD superfamily)
MLNAVMRHCREDSGKIAEQKTQALTTAEVLNGLITTYSRYEAELEEKDRRLAA